MKERYVPIRPGILEHLLRGDISRSEFGTYVTIHMQADYRTGIWRGSAPRILNSAPRGAKLRDIQRELKHLTALGLLKHFHKHGQRGNFPFLINKFTVRSGALTGKRLNADKSQSWRSPVYEACADDDADDSAQDAPIQEVRRKKEQVRKNPAAKPAAPSDPRFRPFVEYAYRSYEAKHGQKPHWSPRDFKNLKTLLGQSQDLTQAELERRWSHYAGSTELFTSKQGDSLAYFCAKFDSFIDGPILGSTGGKTDGKTVSGHQERQKRTLEARERALSRDSRWTDTDRPVLAAGSE